MGALYAFFLLWKLCASLLNALRLTLYVIKFYDYYFAFCVPLLPCRWVPMSRTESSADSMVSNRAHFCGVLFAACLLGVSAICQCFLLGCPFLSFLCRSFFYVFWTRSLPDPFEQRHNAYFILGFHFIFL